MLQYIRNRKMMKGGYEMATLGGWLVGGAALNLFGTIIKCYMGW